MHYQTIVIGLGSMGAATTYYLAQRGVKVLGLEQFALVHENGSHTGQSRIIRQAYAEHPDYVPLLRRAYENWSKFEKLTGEKLINRAGLAYFGPPQMPFIQGVKTSAQAHHIPVEQYTHHTGQAKFPWVNLPDTYHVVWEPDAGYVIPENTIALYAQQAQKLGATLYEHETVQRWQLKGNQVEVISDKNRYTTEKLIITAGAYAGRLLPHLEQPLQVTRQWLTWVQPNQTSTLDELPCWIFEVPGVDGIYYGFPEIKTPWLSSKATQVSGFKIAHHTPGQALTVEQLPTTLDQAAVVQEQRKLRDFIQAYIPALQGEFVAIKQCLYTYSMDGHFMIDYLPNTNRRVVVAAGFSGHGFKFVPALGEVLANLALDDPETDALIDFLRFKRF